MRAHICNDCQYRHHKRYKQPPDSGSKSVFCIACGHYNIGSTLEYTTGHWGRIIAAAQSQYLKSQHNQRRRQIMSNFRVWECKIIVHADVELPIGFDCPPREAAISAIEQAGIEVLGCSSGWGGYLTKEERQSFAENIKQPRPDIYFAGTMDVEPQEQPQ